jgi:hypothetical protein
LGDAGVENPDMQHSSLGLCLQILIPNGMAPLLSINLQALLLSTFSADIFLIVYMIPCMGWTLKFMNLLPMSDSSSIETHSIFATLLEYFA